MAGFSKRLTHRLSQRKKGNALRVLTPQDGRTKQLSDQLSSKGAERPPICLYPYTTETEMQTIKDQLK